MLALRKTGAEARVALHDVPEPVPGPGEVLVEVRAAGICGSDLHIDHGSPSYAFVYRRLPVTLGHELAGVVVAAAADAQGVATGERVVIRPSVTCGRCAACRAGDEDDCEDRSGIGMTRDGGFARLVAVPARNCLSIPDGLSFEAAALTEPLTVSWQAVQRAGLGPGERVLVLGPGPIGLGIALLAQAAGAQVALRGLDDAPRMAVARALGIGDEAGEGPFDACFEASGSAAAVEAGLNSLRKGGRLVLAGLYGRRLELGADWVVRMQIDVRGSHRAALSAWPAVLDMLARDAGRLAGMITHRLALEEALEGFGLAAARQAAKVLLLPAAAPGEIGTGSTG